MRAGMSGIISFLSALTLSACGGGSGSNADSQDNNILPDENQATYRLTFDATWSARTFPTNFPDGPHFSPLIGATHNDQDFIWARNEPSTEGIEDVAETGATDIFNRELEEKRTEGNVESIFRGRSFSSPGDSSVEFQVSESHPLLSAISMIAPSPDWFVGIRDINLLADGQWVDNLEFTLPLYDAGTDTGLRFSSGNADGGTGLITLLTSDENDTDFVQGLNRNTGVAVGTFTLERIDN